MASGGVQKLASVTSGTKFVDIIPPDSILTAPLEAIALVILNSLKLVKPGTALLDHMAISSWANGYRREMRRQVELRLTEAWQHLQQRGLIAPTKVMGTFESWFVTASGHAITSSSDISFGPAQLLPRGLLHEAFADEVLPLYLAGRYDDACGAAYKLLEVCVRDLSKLPAHMVGVDMMREAFKPGLGPLTYTEAPSAEQQAVGHLFAGAMGYYRNAFAHHRIGLTDPRRAASIILLANELVEAAILHHKLREEEQASGESADSP